MAFVRSFGDNPVPSHTIPDAYEYGTVTNFVTNFVCSGVINVACVCPCVRMSVRPYVRAFGKLATGF